jgi:hypothetical protein
MRTLAASLVILVSTTVYAQTRPFQREDLVRETGTSWIRRSHTPAASRRGHCG